VVTLGFVVVAVLAGLGHEIAIQITVSLLSGVSAAGENEARVAVFAWSI
jgi:hypothetical protein